MFSGGKSHSVLLCFMFGTIRLQLVTHMCTTWLCDMSHMHQSSPVLAGLMDGSRVTAVLFAQLQ